jgi:hypothetical protein
MYLRAQKKEVIMNLLIIFIYISGSIILWAIRTVNWAALRPAIFKPRIKNISYLFENNFIEPKVLFATKFNALANISLIKNIDTASGHSYVTENFANSIMAIYQYSTYDHDRARSLFNMTIFVLKNNRMIVLGYDYAEVLYTGKDYDWSDSVMSNLAGFKLPARTKVIGFVKAEVLN